MIKYSSIDMNKFFNEDYADYAIYRVLQRLPHIVDGFAQTQRKVMYTCLDKNIEKKMKVSDLSSVISLHTSYHHGSGSIETTITNLVPKYNNQIPLLKEDGTYGSRSEREPAASRYIETRLYKYTKKIFNNIDNTNFVQEQISEGKKIEPFYTIPLLPLLLINGQSQIGVGYASKILPRDINVIIKLIEDILSGKRKDIPTKIKPKIPLFTGDIIENDNDGWTFLGKIKEIKKNNYLISEVPPKYNRLTYLKVLIDLKDQGKIMSYSENILGDKFEINVKLPTNHKYNTNAKLIKLFKLSENVKENLTVIDTNGKISKKNNIAEVLYEYILFILNIIKQRKNYILDNIKLEILKINNKINFINEINNNTLILKGKTKNILNKELETKSFVKIDNSFNYLLNQTISNLTDEKKEEILNKKKELEKELEIISNKTSAIIWLEDLKEIKSALKKGD